MTIDRIGSIDPIQNGKQTERNARVHARTNPDTISISTEAVEKADLYKAMEIVSSTPDMHAERIAELQKKIDDPAYINDRILNATAEKIMDVFGL